jgi:hypothetical protein
MMAMSTWLHQNIGTMSLGQQTTREREAIEMPSAKPPNSEKSAFFVSPWTKWDFDHYCDVPYFQRAVLLL